MAVKIFFCLILVYLFCSSEATRKKMVIDEDGGADDAFAISLALLYEKYCSGPKVVGLTTTYGNVDLKQAIINSDRILNVCNRQDVPIYRGSDKPLISGISTDTYFGVDGLGDTGYRAPPITTENTRAALALIELSKKYNGDLIVVAIGPLTNIALASRADPSFISRLHRLYIGSGHIQSDDFPNPEFNAAMDPEAYYITANDSRVDKVTFVPYSQVFSSLNISLDWRINTLGKIRTPIMKALNRFERVAWSKSPSWALLDPVVMAIALNENIVEEFRNSTNSIKLEGADRGITTYNFSTPCPTARTFYEANKEKYKKYLLNVFSAGV